MASLLIGFLVEKYACQSRKSDFGIASFFVFHLAFLMRKRVEKSEAILVLGLIVFSASRMVSLSSYCI